MEKIKSVFQQIVLNEALQSAAAKGDGELVDSLLDAGADASSDSGAAFWQAVVNGDDNVGMKLARAYVKKVPNGKNSVTPEPQLRPGD